MKTDAGRALLVVTVTLLALRWIARSAVGFGDSEALYACYTMHLAPGFLDHPGAIGHLLALFGAPPTPLAVHTATALLATAFPLFAALAARGLGASVRGACIAALALAVAPATGVGLFGATPDVPLAWAWMSALGALGQALRADLPARRDSWVVMAAFAAGIAAACKASGALVVAVYLVVVATSPLLRKRAFSWLGIAAGLLPSAPLVVHESQLGFPMLRHRLISSQPGAGFSLRNFAALPGGQMAYVSPLLLLCACLVARGLWRARSSADPVTRMLAIACMIPAIFLVPFCLWSRVAEPHWLAPVYLALALHVGRICASEAGASTLPATPAAPPPIVGRRLGTCALGSAFALTAAAHLWVLLPVVPSLLPRSLDMRYDIANELYGAADLADTLRDVLAENTTLGSTERGAIATADVLPVVGPHWTLCAQIHAALGPNTRVGCEGPIPDDFDEWFPPSSYAHADRLIYVTDTRFSEPSPLLSRYAQESSRRVNILRGGRVVRTFTIQVLTRRGSARRE